MKVKKYRIKKQWILTLKKSMEKQIPRSVVIKQQYLLDRFCPSCDSNLTNFSCYPLNIQKYRYCSYCGQRLRWDKEYGND
mgnify:CR=1 FL=1